MDVVGIGQGEYIGYSYRSRKETVLTDFFRRQHGCTVLGAVGVGPVQNVRVATSSLGGRKCGVAGSSLVVYNDEEGY